MPQVKFQLCMLNTFGVTYSPTNYKIDLYSKQLENKLKVHTKTVVTSEYNAVQTRNLYHCVSHKLRNELLGKLVIYHLSSSHTKMNFKSIKKN